MDAASGAYTPDLPHLPIMRRVFKANPRREPGIFDGFNAA